jgi:putative hemolysin
LTIVVLGIAYLSIVLGELVPKRIALQNANSFVLFAARPMQALALLARPAVALMARSTDLVLALFRVKPAKQPSVSLEDIQHLIETGTAEGILAPVEQRLAVEALRLGERTVKEIMRPRLDIDALDVNTPPSEVLGALAMAGFSRVPVYEGNLDHILGYVHLKDVVRQQYLGWPIDLRKLLHPPLFVPETLPVDKLLVRFQEQRNQMAIVLDEFGGTDGIVTLEDVLEELVGEMRHGESADAQQRIVARGEGSWLIDGLVSVADLVEALRLKEPKERRNYSTVSGIVRSELDRMPKIGDVVSWHGLRIEVVDMDGRRIDRVLVSTQSST